MALDVSLKTTPEKEARRLLFDDPDLSIDEVARTLDKARLPLGKDAISRIRLEVRRSITNEKPMASIHPFVRRRDPFQPAVKVTVINATSPAPEPFNPPRWVNSTPAATPKPVVRPAQAQTPALPKELNVKPVEDQKAAQPEVTTEEKRRWLDDWLLEHPTATVTKAREALHAKFGSALGTTYISETVKVAHSLVEPQPALVSGGVKLVDVADVAHAMKALKIKRIELKGHAYVFDLD
jgi:hypothetical protein